jgi:hypothetical protein
MACVFKVLWLFILDFQNPTPFAHTPFFCAEFKERKITHQNNIGGDRENTNGWLPRFGTFITLARKPMTTSSRVSMQ